MIPSAASSTAASPEAGSRRRADHAAGQGGAVRSRVHDPRRPGRRGGDRRRGLSCLPGTPGRRPGSSGSGRPPRSRTRRSARGDRAGRRNRGGRESCVLPTSRRRHRQVAPLGSSRDHRPRRRTDPLLRRLQHPRSALRRSGLRATGPPTSGGPADCKGSSATGSRSSRRGSTGVPPTSTTTTAPAATGGPTSCPCLQSHHPLDAVVIMLGTNDLKTCFDRTADQIADALRGCLDDLASNATDRGGRTPAVVAGQPDPDRRHRPAVRRDDSRSFDHAGVARSRELGSAIRRVALERGATYADAATVARAGADGLHLTRDSHPRLAELVAATLTGALASCTRSTGAARSPSRHAGVEGGTRLSSARSEAVTREVRRRHMSARQDAPQGWIRRLSGQVWKHKRDVQISFVAAILGSAGQAMVPLIARTIVDDVIGDSSKPLWPWLVLLTLIALAVFGLAYLRRFHNGRSSLAVQYDLRNQLHDHLLTLDQRTLSNLSTGQLVARASSDTTLILGLLNFLPLMFGNVLLMLMSLVIMFWLSPLLACIGLVIAPALFVVSYRLRMKVFPASWDGQQREGEVAEIVDEDVGGVRVVKAFGQEERELHRMVAVVAAALRQPDAGDPAPGALPAAARGDPDARAGRRARARRLAGDAGQHHARHLPGVLDVRHPVRRPRAPARRRPHHRSAGPRRRGADLPGARPRDRDRGRARRGRAARAHRRHRAPRRALRVRRGRGAARARPPRPRRRAGRPRGLLGQRQVDGRRPGPAAARPRPRVRSWSTGTTSAASRCTPSGARSAQRSGRASSSPTRSPPTSPTAGRARAARRSRPRPASRAPTTSSASSPTATTPRSASAG